MNDNSGPPVPSPSRIFVSIAERLRLRTEFLVTVGIGVLALVILQALTWSAGVLTMAAALAYCFVRPPRVAGDGGTRQRTSRWVSDRDADRQRLVEAMPDPAWILDASSIVLNANQPARGIFPGLRTGITIAVAARNPDLIEAVGRALSTGAAQTATLHQRVPIERRLSVVVAPLRIDGGRPRDPALLLTLRDLTEQDRLSQMRADFVANASHELRTPLSALRGFVETLQGPARDDAAARERFLAIMARQAERMTRLIDDLLSLSRIEMREHLAPTASVDLTDLVPLALQGLEPQAAQASVKLTFEAEPRPMIVRGDRDELQQVVQNLVVNAIKYGREGGKVDVHLRRREPGAGRPSCIELSVVDDGAGIAAEHLPRLTERFYRVNAPQSRDKGGTGLGLAIVKHIVTRHGGDLQISSKVGEGSTFLVVFAEIT